MADRFILYDLILYKMVINVNFCFKKKFFCLKKNWRTVRQENLQSKSLWWRKSAIQRTNFTADEVCQEKLADLICCGRSLPCEKYLGTIIGGLSPRRIRRGSDRIRSDPIGSANQSARASAEADLIGLRRTQKKSAESA